MRSAVSLRSSAMMSNAAWCRCRRRASATASSSSARAPPGGSTTPRHTDSGPRWRRAAGRSRSSTAGPISRARRPTATSSGRKAGRTRTRTGGRSPSAPPWTRRNRSGRGRAPRRDTNDTHDSGGDMTDAAPGPDWDLLIGNAVRLDDAAPVSIGIRDGRIEAVAPALAGHAAANASTPAAASSRPPSSSPISTSTRC